MRLCYYSPPSEETVLAKESQKTLIIAEKPSVAQDLIKALPGKFEKHDAFWESDHYLVSFALGHLVSLATPKDMGDQYKGWSLASLPIIPETFAIKALPRTKTQLSTLAKLIRRKDVSEIINACDAGREGELIFHYILQYVSEQKPVKTVVKRLWLQSMTKTAMEEGFRHLRAGEEMRNLAQAAQCRSEADWLVGINGSRALTGYKSQYGGFFLTPCGRVQTPTLSIMVRREDERNRFVPREYFEVHADFSLAGGASYAGRWFDPDFEKRPSDEVGKPERIRDGARANAIAEKCRGQIAEVAETQKPSLQSSPPLYDLTALQRESNGRFGFSAKTTLSIAQALYERHKVLTYPRTDSRHLPDDYLSVAKGLMKSLRGGEFGAFAAEAMEQGYVRPDKRIFDGSKVSDHFAIIPTQVIPEGLSDAERKIYQAVTQRFLAVFFPPARFLQTSRISVVEGENFRTEGKVLEIPGWKAIYGVDPSEEAALPALIPGKPVTASRVDVRRDQTNPPPRFTESTLLSFMESAGKFVEDEELRAAMKERGLGTPATRAAIIEGLIDDKYIVREGKELIPTAKSIDLFRLLAAMNIEELTSPELTGEWEFKLNRIEKGQFTRAAFMGEIQDLTRRMVRSIKAYDEEKDRKPAGFANPLDGKPMQETPTRWESEDGKVMIRKVLGGRQMSEAEVVELLQKRRLGPLQGFRSKQGRPFSAAIRLTDANKVEFVFEDSASGEKPEIVNPEPLGKSPVDGTPVFETLASYISESAINGDSKLGFRLGKVILGKSLDRENVAKMLAGEKTSLLQGFQSSKTRRFFDAYLKVSPQGKLQFEFPPREFKGRGRFGKAKKAEADA